MSMASLWTASIIDEASSILTQCSIAFSMNLQSEENTPWFMGSGIGAVMSMAFDSVMNLRLTLGGQVRHDAVVVSSRGAGPSR